MTATNSERRLFEPASPPATTRLPGPDDSDPLDAALGAANERGRRDSLAVLGELLPAVPFEAIAQSADGSVLAGSCAASGVLRHWVDGADLLDRLLARHDIGHGHQRLVHDRTEVPLAPASEQVHALAGLTTRLVSAPLVDQLGRGATFVMNAIDLQDRGVLRFSEHVERVFGCQVNINGYLSLRPEPGFNAHWDDHEVFIIQLLGQKEWEVHEPALLSPNRLMAAADTTGRVVWKGLVGPGGVLHVPRGWGHDARSTDELSFHLTVGVARLANVDLIDRLLGEGGRRRAAREPVGNLGDAPTSQVREPLRRLSDELATEDAIGGVIAAERQVVPGRSTQSVHALLDALGRPRLGEIWVRSAYGGGFAVGGDAADRPTVLFGGRCLSVESRALEVVAPLLDGRAHAVADVVAVASGPAADLADEAIREALRAGVLEVVDDPADWGVVVAGA